MAEANENHKFSIITIQTFVDDNFHQQSPHREQALQKMNELNQYRHVVVVPGDGLCLIYSIIFTLINTRNREVVINTILEFCSEKMMNVLMVNGIGDCIMDYKFMHELAINIRTRVCDDWDYNNSSDYNNPLYHMNDNAIDGLARDKVMRLLGVEKITVHSLNPCNESSTRIFTVSKPIQAHVTPWNIVLICAQGYNHYSAIF